MHLLSSSESGSEHVTDSCQHGYEVSVSTDFA